MLMFYYAVTMLPLRARQLYTLTRVYDFRHDLPPILFSRDGSMPIFSRRHNIR